MNQILELRQKIGGLQDGLQAITALAAKESRAFTPEENEKFDKIYDDIAVTRKTIENIERLDALRTQTEQRSETTARQRHENKGEPTTEERHAAAFKEYLQRGENNLSTESRAVILERETRAQSVTGGSTTAGGYVVPEGFRSDLAIAQKFYGAILNTRVEIVNTDSGNPLPWPTLDDTTNEGAQIDENTDDSDQDVAFGAVTLGAYVFTSKFVKLSREFIMDEGVNFQAKLADILGQRLGRIMNKKATVGTGSSTPQGIVVGATLGKTGTTGQTTTITYADIVDLIYSVDKAHRAVSEFMFNDSMEKAILKLVDGQNRPLFWNDSGSLQDGKPARLLGYPYVINNDVASMAASAKSMLFGNMRAHKIRRCPAFTTLERLTERFAEKRQVAFVAFERWDSRFVDPGEHPVKYYQNPAS